MGVASTARARACAVAFSAAAARASAAAARWSASAERRASSASRCSACEARASAAVSADRGRGAGLQRTRGLGQLAHHRLQPGHLAPERVRLRRPLRHVVA
jgi:hypothetical protein